MTAKTALQLAFERAGGAANLARLLGFKRRRVQRWKDQGVIPPQHIPAVSKATGIPRELLAPELYE